MYKIVIVDDEPIQCKGLKNILNKMYDFLEIQVFVEAEAAQTADGKIPFFDCFL